MAGTADALPDLTGLGKAEQLAALRRSMASIPGRRDHAPTDSVDAIPFTPSRAHASAAQTADDRALSGPVRSQTLRTIPTPAPLTELLPRGALARGTALSITGAGSILVGLVATASAAGHHVALIGQPKFGLLAVHEQGGDLSKIHLIDPGQADPLDAASVCIEGLDLVVTTVHGRDVPPTRARALLARNRTHAGVLAITDGHMPGLDMTISSRPVAYGGIEQGRGRIRSITIDTTVHGRGITERTGRYTLTAPTFGEHELRWTPVAVDAAADHRPHRLVVAQ
ncbi:hypothetical protein KZO37_21430 [Rhodococcus fascians]|uniref:hypothetical protein n=1 Tax=Rhodococcoides fascians TaxID=1828 RepID=UPI001C604D13|nr:hypothetical protein [Rhodococcus fascians]MBW4781927.1 hypothetical protein [Rhodococcus fascians]